MKFSGICLTTKSVPRLVSFYETVFCTTATGDDWHAELSFCGLNLAIFSEEGMEQMAKGSMRDAGCGKATLMFEVDNVDLEYERLKTLHVEFVMHPTTHPWGARSLWFRDLDGNIIDFFARIV